MRDGLLEELEGAWQVLMILSEDRFARAVAEAKHELMRLNAVPTGEPRALMITVDDAVKARDGAG